MFDFLIVGAGYSGCVLAERIATQLNKKVLIIDKRPHIAGNAYDYYDDHGVLVHKYGPHIFHTNSKNVWDYLSRFTDWRPYEHKVLAVVDGIKVPVPFNLHSIDKIFSQEKAKDIHNLLIGEFGINTKIPILKLRESKNSEIKDLANFIYDKIFYGYTLKQWGFKPEDLDPSVSSRVPVYISEDDRYFQDTFQGIPKEGYTEMFKKIIRHPNIEVLLNTDFLNSINGGVKFNKLIFTGPIDEYFGYVHGELPYRSLRFKLENLKQNYFQETGQINYPNDFEYTRITEFKHITGKESSSTTIAYEFPQQYVKNINEPYYPIPKADTTELYKKYEFEAEKIKNIVKFVGRLADYKYYNMDQIVARALTVFERVNE